MERRERSHDGETSPDGLTGEPNAGVSRRGLMAGAGMAAASMLAACASTAQVQGGPSQEDAPPALATIPVKWVSTTKDRPWREITTGIEKIPLKRLVDFHVGLTAEALQTIDGFGACFNEQGWQALSALKTADRETLLHDFFEKDAGANFSICRMPIGANDYALDWYSHNETPGDFAMSNFSIERDRKALIPYIMAARAIRLDLALWASPWSPPTWMKTNGHYACAAPRPGAPGNGIRPDQVRKEGEDTFIQEERYFRAYALYFQRFVEEYGRLGVKIGMVMPQNEFNSPQAFPSCTWTPEGLARFLPFLGEAMGRTGTDIFLGTLERSDPNLFERVHADTHTRRLIRGAGVQWAGRQAAPFIHRAHPDLKIYQTEQECGNGLNDWRFARYSWTMMKDFMRAGASVYDYWNPVTPTGGVSTWGWPQNSMVSVDLASGAYTINPDYYVFKHLSHFVKPGARRIGTSSIAGYDNILAFRNPDGGSVIVVQNDMTEAMPLHITIGPDTFRCVLPADSFNTLVI